jgi:hypothetical protein
MPLWAGLELGRVWRRSLATGSERRGFGLGQFSRSAWLVGLVLRARQDATGIFAALLPGVTLCPRHFLYLPILYLQMDVDGYMYMFDYIHTN